METQFSQAEVFPPLLAALQKNLTPADLRAFLVYAEAHAFPVPTVNADSETREVAAWCVTQGLNATVTGQWVWVDPYQQPGRTKEDLEPTLRAAGFWFSKRRQSFFHKCTVESHSTKRGGKLERFHGTTSAADYPAGHDPRPDWKRRKDRKRSRKAA